jgi:hypothetical protein
VLLLVGSSLPFALQAATAPVQFDMGTQDSPLGEGYVAVFADTVYSEERGFGWDRSADRGFYSEWKVPERFRKWHPNHAGPLSDGVLADGAICEEPIRFVVDVPPGRYSVYVTVGGDEDKWGQARGDCAGIRFLPRGSNWWIRRGMVEHERLFQQPGRGGIHSFFLSYHGFGLCVQWGWQARLSDPFRAGGSAIAMEELPGQCTHREFALGRPGPYGQEVHGRRGKVACCFGGYNI